MKGSNDLIILAAIGIGAYLLFREKKELTPMQQQVKSIMQNAPVEVLQQLTDDECATLISMDMLQSTQAFNPSGDLAKALVAIYKKYGFDFLSLY